MTRSPVWMPRPMPPVVPTRMRRVAPRRSSSSTTIENDGVPMPVVWTLTGTPVVGAGVAEQRAVVVDLARGLEAAVEQRGDARRALGVAGQQHERGVVADLGAQVDLGHGWALLGVGLRATGSLAGRGSATVSRVPTHEYLELTDWRRAIAELYARWRRGRPDRPRGRHARLARGPRPAVPRASPVAGAAGRSRGLPGPLVAVRPGLAPERGAGAGRRRRRAA